MNKFKEKKELVYKTIIICIIVVAILIFIPQLITGSRTQSDYLNFSDINFLEIDSEHEVMQKFVSSYSYIKKISLFPVNIVPGMKNMELTILNGKGKIIFQKKYLAEALQAGVFNDFPVNVYVGKNKELWLRITYSGEQEGDYLGIMAVPSSKKDAHNRECVYAGKDMEMTLAMGYEYIDVPPMEGIMVGVAIFFILFLFVLSPNKENAGKTTGVLGEY